MRQEKQLLLDEISDQMEGSESFVLMGYKSFTANKANLFRKEVAKFGGAVEVVKKRVLIQAAKTRGIDLNLKMLPGHIGLVFGGKDILETTKYLFKFGAENENSISVLGGRFEGTVHGPDAMKQLSELPGKDEMRAQLLAVLEAPMAETLATMEAIISSVIYCLDNKSQQN